MALEREGGEIKMYVSGVKTGETWNVGSSFNFNQSTLRIGSGVGTDSLNGHIDELRITKGIARYTKNFTPPDAPFPNY